MGHDAHDHDHDHAHGHDHDHDHGHGHDHDHGHGHDHDHGHAHARGHDHDHDHGHGHAEEVVKGGSFGYPRRRVAIGEGVEIAAIDRGAGAPVLLLHGFPTSASLFRNVIPALEDRARLIAPDLLGFGETSGPIDAPLGLDAQTEYVVRLLDALEVGEATVVGHDWGGAIAQALAVRHPERVARLILVDCPAFDYTPGPEVGRLIVAARYSPIFDLVCDTGLFRALAYSRLGFRQGAHRKEAFPDEAIAHYIDPVYRDTPPAYRTSRELWRRALLTLYDECPRGTAQLVDGLRRFEKPTLVVWGCEDPYVSLSYGKRLADEIPGCTRLELIAFCGHWVPEERPAELATLIAEFAELGGAAAPTAAAVETETAATA